MSTGSTPSGYLAVVPARGGSKRIPGKNLVALNGIPLIDYTLRAAQSARRLSAVVVSTDDEQIARHCRERGVAVPEMRPADLAGDRSPVVEALVHAMAAFERSGGGPPKAIVLLQPTSPFRKAEDIDRAIESFEIRNADTVVAVRAIRDHPYWAWRKDGDRIEPVFSRTEMAMDRQLLPEAYAENGALYIIRRELVLNRSLYGARVVPYLMDDAASIDIDTPLDLAWAQFLLARGLAGKAHG